MTRIFFCTFLWFISLLGTDLTIEEKVGQLLFVHFRGESFDDKMEKALSELHPGGIIYFPFANGLTDFTKITALSTALQSKSQIPLFIAADQEGGRVAFYPFPAQREQAGLPIYELTLGMGKILNNLGINLNLSPVVDVDSNPNNPVIGNRSFSNDAATVIKCAQEAIRGYKESGIFCCLKHFPGHGDTDTDSHLGLPVINKSLEDLNKVELAPFYQLHNQTNFIMTAHLLVPALDEHNPATLSSKTLRDLLRNQWGYKGIILSDSLIMRALTPDPLKLKETALHAFNAGCDMLLICGRIRNEDGSYYEPSPAEYLDVHNYLVTCVKNGIISEERLNESVDRILNLKKKYRYEASYP